ncbi:unnamed protein product [Nezara viridula]|uniref:Uncharacterized protein n=1 Tax=Nezara viridula TaxID=85310 RepID=A0A9P0H8E9_NEZVI|nr:unnamed protein product [Nezara viridula]
MARPFERLKGLNIAALIEEAVNNINPEKGLTHEEMVDYVCDKLGFEQTRVQAKVNEILNLGTQTGALLVTDGKGYTLNDNNKLRRLALDAGRKPRKAKRRREISRKRHLQRRR